MEERGKEKEQDKKWGPGDGEFSSPLPQVSLPHIFMFREIGILDQPANKFSNYCICWGRKNPCGDFLNIIPSYTSKPH